MYGTQFSFEDDQSVTFSSNLLRKSIKSQCQLIDFESITIEQEVPHSKTEEKESESFIDKIDESTEIDSLLSSLKGEGSFANSLNLKFSTNQSECEEILAILKNKRNSEPVKKFSNSSPEFFRCSEKKNYVQEKTNQTGNEHPSQPKIQIFAPAAVKRAPVCNPRLRCVPERVSNPFVKNFCSDLDYKIGKSSN